MNQIFLAEGEFFDKSCRFDRKVIIIIVDKDINMVLSRLMDKYPNSKQSDWIITHIDTNEQYLEVVYDYVLC